MWPWLLIRWAEELKERKRKMTELKKYLRMNKANNAAASESEVNVFNRSVREFAVLRLVGADSNDDLAALAPRLSVVDGSRSSSSSSTSWAMRVSLTFDFFTLSRGLRLCWALGGRGTVTSVRSNRSFESA